MTITPVSKGNGQGHIVDRYRFTFTDEFVADPVLSAIVDLLRARSDKPTPARQAPQEKTT